MSANYSLVLSNPRAHANPPSVVYTGVQGGNTLDLIVGNDFPFDLTIGGGSVGKDLFVDISANILDAAGAAALTVAAPWAIEGVTPPPEAPPRAPRCWRFSLRPPAAGVPFASGSTITIALGTLAPSAVGVALVAVHYRFDDVPSDDLRASATLSSLAPPDPAHAPLVGGNGALRLTIGVNRGPVSNPIMVSATPVTAANAVDNELHVNLLFQQATESARLQASDQPGLVPHWDRAHPPAFRIFFPYQSASETLPAALDLTDSLLPGAPHYNLLTSAWNILGTLDPHDPTVTDDGFWHIVLETDAGTPAWRVTPTPANTYLFTTVESSSSEPGPFLDWWLEKIVSGLVIDPQHPETVVFLQWNNFPGFSDGLVAYPLFKTPLAVNAFSGRIRRTDRGPELTLEWTTTGAESCLLTGESAPQRACAQGDEAFHRIVTAEHPLRSEYELTALGPGGATRVSQRIVSRWRFNDRVEPFAGDGTSGLAGLPDGQTLLVLKGNPGGIYFYDADTLRPRNDAPMTAGGEVGILAFVVTEEGKTIYAAGNDGRAYGFDVESHAAIPGSGVENFSGTAFPPFPLALSQHDVNLAFLTSVTDLNNTPYGLNQMVVLSASDFQPVQGSPVGFSDSPATLAIGKQTNRYYVGVGAGLAVLDGTTFQPLPGSPVAVGGTGLLAVPRDEHSIYGVALAVGSQTVTLFAVDGATLRVQRQIPVDLLLFPLPVSAIVASPDNRQLFVGGLSLAAFKDNRLASRLSVYDGATLDEVSWSPLKFDDKLMPFTFTLSPDSTRIFVLAARDVGKPSGGLFLCAVDPEFV